MSLWLPPNALGKTQTNLTAAARQGTVITASATPHTKGAYSAGQLIAAADEDCYGISIAVTDVGTAATDTSFLLDIGIGPSGSERDLIRNLDCWGAPIAGGANQAAAKTWYFPVFIPKGYRVAARAQALAVSDTANVVVCLHQACNGWGMEVPSLWESLGTITNSDGVSVTPGSGAFGSWTTILDPITKPYSWWHVGYGAINDTTITTGGHVVVEIGFGDTSAAVTTIGQWRFVCNTAEFIGGPYPAMPVFWPVTADTVNGVFARIASFETEARSVLVYAGE